MKDRHAYLIMTHGNFEILKLQLEMLDDSRNDIYIHVDKKVKNFDFLFFRTYVKKAHIEFTKKRINVRWGGPRSGGGGTDTGLSGTSFV